jgi:hypothetical protein
MNNTQAKFILQSYQADGRDARDPAFREALEQARRDPVMAHWLEEERTTDQVVQSKLREVIVPSSLVDDILATQTIRVASSFWTRHGRVLAWAAVLMVLLGGMLMFAPSSPPLSYDSYAAVAADFVSGPFHLELRTKKLDDVKAWLSAKGAPADVMIPTALASAADAGIACRSFSWRDQSVMLMCFTLEDGRPAHLFVMNVRDLPDAPSDGLKRYERHGKWSTASWVSGDSAFVLATVGNVNNVEEFL